MVYVPNHLGINLLSEILEPYKLLSCPGFPLTSSIVLVAGTRPIPVQENVGEGGNWIKTFFKYPLIIFYILISFKWPLASLECIQYLVPILKDDVLARHSSNPHVKLPRIKASERFESRTMVQNTSRVLDRPPDHKQTKQIRIGLERLCKWSCFSLLRNDRLPERGVPTLNSKQGCTVQL